MRTPISPAVVGMLAQAATNGAAAREPDTSDGSPAPAKIEAVISKAKEDASSAHADAMAASTGGPEVLTKLVLPASYAESLAGVKKKLAHVPVRRPHRTWWWWSNPAFEMRVATLNDENGGQEETYLVSPDLMAEYPGEVAPATIHGAINRQGTFFIICARLPGPDGRLANGAAHHELEDLVFVRTRRARRRDVVVRNRMRLPAHLPKERVAWPADLGVTERRAPLRARGFAFAIENPSHECLPGACDVGHRGGRR